MKRLTLLCAVLLASSAIALTPSGNERATTVRHLNQTFMMPVHSTKDDWLRRRAELRLQSLVSLGLHPLPERTALNPMVFRKIIRDDYTVEQVYFESLPGFYVAGNLYRPLPQWNKRRPAILNPHGHSSNGRLVDVELGSIAGRCIGQARRGYVAFTWDMVGYNDSLQLAHNYPGAPLYGLSLMALQTWNSIRAIDFLQSLPDVDPNHIGVTGESGGGTQTFMLCAVDDRVQWAAPVNMISSHMQGGCLCENAPGLRIGTNNMEIGALFAPKPLLLVSCTGDWTVNTPKIEYPALKEVYDLLGAGDRLSWVQIDAAHNYNKPSREAVYGFFAKWIDGKGDGKPAPEATFAKEPDASLRVFATKADLPLNARTPEQLTQYWIDQSEVQLEASRRAGSERFAESYGPALRHALHAAYPLPAGVQVYPASKDFQPTDALAWTPFHFGRLDGSDQIPAALAMPKSEGKLTATVLVGPNGRAGGMNSALARKLFTQGHAVLTIDAFNSGEAMAERVDRGYFTTYNRTDTSERVQDVLTAVAFLRARPDIRAVNVIGRGNFGPLTLLANALAGEAVTRCVVDYAEFTGTDTTITQDLFSPSLRRAGDLRTAVALASMRPLLVHNACATFPSNWLRRSTEVSATASSLDDDAIVRWLTN